MSTSLPGEQRDLELGYTCLASFCKFTNQFRYLFFPLRKARMGKKKKKKERKKEKKREGGRKTHMTGNIWS